GVDFYQSMAKQNSYAQFAYDTVSLSQPISPVSAPKINAMTANLSPNYNESHQYTYSVYLSDVIDVTSRLNAMVSLRLDRYENKPYKTNGVAAATGHYNQTALSPKLGLVYQVVKDQVSLFGNYMNGFANVAPFTQPDGEISIFKPRHANQLETGVKAYARSEEHTSELQSREKLVCRLLLEKKKNLYYVSKKHIIKEINKLNTLYIMKKITFSL